MATTFAEAKMNAQTALADHSATCTSCVGKDNRCVVGIDLLGNLFAALDEFFGRPVGTSGVKRRVEQR
jgi:hypothetical protein